MSDYVEPINIGNPDETTILEFAEEIIKLTGTDQKIVFKTIAHGRSFTTPTGYL